MTSRSRCSRGSLTVYSRRVTVTPGRSRQQAASQGSAREAWEYLACRVASRIFISERDHIAAITALYLSFQRDRQHVQVFDDPGGVLSRDELGLESNPAVEDIQGQQFGLPFSFAETKADHGAGIRRFTLAGKGEVAQAVKDDTCFVALYPPQYVRVMADDHIL